jgi:thiamine biosynthesis lipoprotein
MITAEKSVKNLMSCDAYFCASSNELSEAQILADIEEVYKYLSDFSYRFSRFIKGNELDIFNTSNGKGIASPELAEILEVSQVYKDLTGGVFDINILPDLLSEGYVASISKGFLGDWGIAETKRGNTIDLGGIGKGFSIDKAAQMLRKKYKDFCVEIGGDMYVGGTDRKNNYDFWAIEVEDPLNQKRIIDTLLVRDKGIATSGINRRKWKKGNEDKHHIIDPFSGKSVYNDIISVTVIGDNATFADVIAKSILIMGIQEGLIFADKHKIPALIVDINSESILSENMEAYVWKA